MSAERGEADLAKMILRLLQVLAMPGIGSLTREVIARGINPGCACGYGECRA
jgi:hypothetical protein